MVGGLSGCGSAGSTTASAPVTGSTSTPQTQTQDTSNATTTAAPDFGITIDSTSQTTDDDGNAAIMVAFTFTNNSNAATTFLDQAIFVDASQGQTNLDSAVINGDDSDIANAGKEIAPGGSVQIHWAYKLVDKSDVTIEATIMSNGNTVTLDTKTVPVS